MFELIQFVNFDRTQLINKQSKGAFAKQTHIHL
ncbi:hypothetical protein RUMOBE_02636 [Blautia obeum ATCC 29174]|uniref:Uncharacterized protein n=1 Tax=Blautia obeum ATCC 29174 TaxID=411459 RepID=A5ZUF1_9FIRM|nr:hypothetical protein RUMOBE_02636 [Blautia obeum ATCC 29174]